MSELAVMIIKLAIQYGIPAATAAVELMKKPDPKPEDFDVFLKTLAKSYDDYINEAKLKKV